MDNIVFLNLQFCHCFSESEHCKPLRSVRWQGRHSEICFLHSSNIRKDLYRRWQEDFESPHHDHRKPLIPPIIEWQAWESLLYTGHELRVDSVPYYFYAVQERLLPHHERAGIRPLQSCGYIISDRIPKFPYPDRKDAIHDAG